MRPKTVAATLSLVLVSCAGDGTVTTSDAATTTSSSVAATSTLPPVIECPGAGEFEEGGGIADVDGEGSDSSHIGRISWTTSDLCETFTIEFDTSEGAPATVVPTIRIEHLESFQVVRITMDVEAAVVTDQLVETNLVERLYAVRSFNGGMFVDLHLAAPAAVRASTRSSPAQLALELRPGFVPFAGHSSVADDVVVVAPTSGAAVGTNTELSGYARTLEANVLVVVTQGDDVLSQTSTTAADSLETWGEFAVDVGLPPGPVSVFLGEANPQDGSLRGVTVDLTVS